METGEPRNSGMGITLPEPAGEAVNVWRRLYDPSFDMLWPHITLAYPPFVSPEVWPQVKPIIAACLEGFQPFRITLKETGIFQGDPLHVLWLKPEDGGTLARMRRALEKALPEYVPPLPFDYQPHVSIGFFQDLRALQQAQEKVRNELAPVVFQAHMVGYAFQDPDGTMHIHDQVPIGGEIFEADPGEEPGGKEDHGSHPRQ